MLATALSSPVDRRAKRYSSALVGLGASSLDRKLWISVDFPEFFAPTKSSSLSTPATASRS